ncbi:MAG: response regulator transcription factor [Lachnospiraceae bacterium]|nr:response regulator transcription factor [Lachnospiraceae bacterium]
MVENVIKVAICDDEPFMAEEISGHLSGYMKEKGITSYCVRVFFDGRSLLESGCDFDMVFLDIRMEPTDGMETARMLRQQGSHSLLIFITILKECVFDAFEVEAYDYLVKPIDAVHFRRTMDRATQFWEQRAAKSIIIQKGTSCEVVLLSDIVYCEVQGRKIYLHQKDGRIIDYYHKLSDFEEHVDGRFFKCHRSYLVNLDYVRGCNAGQVLLPQGDAIPVSRLRERDLARALLRHMKGREL